MKTHPADHVRHVLAAHFPHARIRLLDTSYATLTPEAWPKVHTDFVARMWGKDLTEWLAEQGDCDDWSWLFRADVIERNWQQQGSRVPVACFYIHYTTRDGVYHAANAAVVCEGERLSVLAIEPQPDGGTITLTPQERTSCDLCIG